MRAVFIAVLVALAGAAAADDRQHAATVFAGNLLDDDWEDVFLDPAGLSFENARLAGGALSARVWRPVEGLDVEIEGQLVRHFGEQDHWEVNAPLAVARWTGFPWSGTVATSAAFGIGPSLASRTPRLEVANEGSSERVMVYWMIEIELGAPGSDWSWVGRLHHRSPAYGLFGDDGGSNALAVGLRRRF
jgi:hypothetical protein